MEKNKILRDMHHDYRRLVEFRAEEPQDESGDLIIKGTPIIFGQEYKLFDFSLFLYGDRFIFFFCWS